MIKRFFFKDFTLKGFRYLVYIRPWKKKRREKYEFVKHVVGWRKNWEHINEDTYMEAYNSKFGVTLQTGTLHTC